MSLSREVREMPKVTSYKAFSDIYKNPKNNGKNSGGGIIFNEDLSKILLIKGRYSGKWGCPKGHHNLQDEDNLHTALREISEETGYQTKLRSRLLPNVTIDKVKLYCLLVSETADFNITDVHEISEIKWFDIENLKELVKKYPHRFNSLIRGAKGLYRKMSNIIYKIQLFMPNYKHDSEGYINNDLHKIISSCEKRENASEFHYSCFLAIQQKYPDVFNEMDLILFVKNLM